MAAWKTPVSYGAASVGAYTASATTSVLEPYQAVELIFQGATLMIGAVGTLAGVYIKYLELKERRAERLAKRTGGEQR